MGRANQQRRRAKQKKAREQQRRRDARGFGQYSGGDRELVLALIDQAVHALHHGRHGAESEPLTILAGQEPPSWRRTVDRTLFSVLEDAVGHAWHRGWQPAELVREARRENGRRAAALVTDVVVAENRRHAAAGVAEDWARQVRELGEPWWGTDADHADLFAQRHGLGRDTCVETALRVLALLHGLPALQVFLPLPGTARTTPTGDGAGADPAKLARIRGLLAKAEATEFPEEAEALTSRAQQMMARHSIDHAALVAETGTVSEVGGRRLPVDAPYEHHKATLLNVVAQANNCRSVWHDRLGMCTVMGFPDEVNMVELLFTSLLVQATRAMQRAGSTRDAHGRSTTRSFRSSFLASFATRIGERLSRSADSEEERAVREYAEEGTDLLPVLASRVEKVEEAVSEVFPELETTRLSGASNARGWEAGRAAADAATLHTGERLETGGP
ncbi:DUF2786 domain-containing protein [Nocardiopsis halotolerans]|uniref:DUF2786 domain-containing protein n=1 Tax=Nocardiopsis halotolerans TaxID=124252 RepID=UPI00034BBB31|nr:DUF2786 domain-containing protein [Nocardiopsis halotolerans]